MNQEYLFKELRKGATASRQIVVTGYCTAEFMDDKTLSACIIRNGAKTILSCGYEVVPAPSFQGKHGNEKKYSRLLTVCITVSMKIEPKDQFQLLAQTEDGTQIVMCSNRGETLIKEFQKIYYSIDTVKEEAGYFVPCRCNSGIWKAADLSEKDADRSAFGQRT